MPTNNNRQNDFAEKSVSVFTIALTCDNTQGTAGMAQDIALRCIHATSADTDGEPESRFQTQTRRKLCINQINLPRLSDSN